LTLGGVDPKYAASPFVYYPLANATYWLIDMEEMSFDGQSIRDGEKFRGIVDTGTSVIVGPTDKVNKILAKFDNPKTIDCDTVDTHPNLEFTIGKELYTLEPKDYILKVTVMGQS